MTFLLINAIFIPVLLGILFIYKIAKSPYIFVASLSFGLGLGLLAQWIFILLIMKWPISLLSITTPLFLLAGVFYLFLYFSPQEKKAQPHNPFNFIDGILLIFIFWNVVYSFILAFSFPIYHWDEIALHSFKAKLFFFDQSLEKLPFTTHASYPLFVSLIQTWVVFNIGYWDDILVKLMFPLGLLSLLGVLFSTIKEFFSSRWALIGCLFLVSANIYLFHTHIAYADFYLSYYLTLSVCCWLWWQKTNDVPWLVLSGVFSGFMSSVKLEGIFYILIVAIAILLTKILFKAKIESLFKEVTVFLMAALPTLIVFFLFKYVVHLPALDRGHVELDVHTVFSQFLPTMGALINNFLFTNNWSLIWVIVFIIVLMNFLYGFKRSVENMVLLLILCFSIGFLIILGTFTSCFEYIGGDKSFIVLSRLIIHFYPIAVLVAVFWGATITSLKGFYAK